MPYGFAGGLGRKVYRVKRQRAGRCQIGRWSLSVRSLVAGRCQTGRWSLVAVRPVSGRCLTCRRGETASPSVSGEVRRLSRSPAGRRCRFRGRADVTPLGRKVESSPSSTLMSVPPDLLSDLVWWDSLSFLHFYFLVISNILAF